ncbi:hypothetical protein PoB_002992000 [Plakobranchus ocellatus]|uniref:Uncharacterized protein n=1 Tax=Plakobranchus ocellatus TaxID=259542 RepID=A0AAV4A5I4_9GAST|nr:hypothetical protein PoB_002992000 [Plakobranchus ocellatus]
MIIVPEVQSSRGYLRSNQRPRLSSGAVTVIPVSFISRCQTPLIAFCHDPGSALNRQDKGCISVRCLIPSSCHVTQGILYCQQSSSHNSPDLVLGTNCNKIARDSLARDQD